MKTSSLMLAGSPAFTFVLMMGVVNLFGDMTYAGGASINGPFLGTLGAAAVAISIIGGLSEFLGYTVRSVAGYLADKTGRYWLVTFIGYALNLFLVPAMALSGNWQIAGALILAQGIGRGIRKPTVAAMLSYSTGRHGKGRVYAVNAALDQTGATVGPLFMALALFLNASYQTGYALLLISACLAIASLVAARVVFPVPSRLEQPGEKTAQADRFTASYWLYVVAGACFAAGLSTIALIAYHLSHSGTVPRPWIPLFLAVATGIAALTSLLIGWLYDRIGIWVVLGAVCLTAVFPPLVFLGGFNVALLGMVFWGVGEATERTLLSAIIVGVLPKGRRNLAFGLFYLGFGGGFLVGGVTMGLLYDYSRALLSAFAVAAMLASVPFFLLAARRQS
ncbi:MFS transporter [Tautonia sociabilis]|uniref:MFS transporter n=1 Tax=Tautonia sociabilis TaxID=2080755 RepID=A0A432MDC7_9BACT|nr:MFS transporter [Tautonia sociabilis]RUL82536.1 MFS transporter [Tautonia sociabilis]